MKTILITVFMYASCCIGALVPIQPSSWTTNVPNPTVLSPDGTVSVNNNSTLSTDGSASFASGNFTISTSGGIVASGGNFQSDASGNIIANGTASFNGNTSSTVFTQSGGATISFGGSLSDWSWNTVSVDSAPTLSWNLDTAGQFQFNGGDLITGSGNLIVNGNARYTGSLNGDGGSILSDGSGNLYAVNLFTNNNSGSAVQIIKGTNVFNGSISVTNQGNFNTLAVTNGARGFGSSLTNFYLASVSNGIPVAVTVGASPFKFTNNTPNNLRCDVGDSTSITTSVGRNGVTVFSSTTDLNVEMNLFVGEYITLTYSGGTPTLFTNR